MLITPEEMNTPMFCALHEHKGQNKSSYLKSISNQSGIMFWLGYLYKKISQNSCEQQVRLINEKGYKEFLKDQKQLSAQIATEVTRKAKRDRQFMMKKEVDPDTMTKEEIKEVERNK